MSEKHREKRKSGFADGSSVIAVNISDTNKSNSRRTRKIVSVVSARTKKFINSINVENSLRKINESTLTFVANAASTKIKNIPAGNKNSSLVAGQKVYDDVICADRKKITQTIKTEGKGDAYQL